MRASACRCSRARCRSSAFPRCSPILGPRVNSLRLWRREPKPVGEGVWHRIAMFVMRRPVPIAIVVIVVLLALGIPFLRIQFGLPDDRVLPPTFQAARCRTTSGRGSRRTRAERSRSSQPGSANPTHAPLTSVTTQRSCHDCRGRRAVDAFTGSYIDGRQVAGPGPLGARFEADDATWLSVVPSVEPYSDAGERLANAVRDTRAPFPVLVTGPSAELVDSNESIFARLPSRSAWSPWQPSCCCS